MFPFGDFNFLPTLSLIAGFFDSDPGIFLQYNTSRMNTFLYLKRSKSFHSLNFKFYGGMIGIGVDSLNPLLTLGAYSESFWTFSAIGLERFYLNGFVRHNNFLGGLRFFLKKDDYQLGIAGGYSFKGFDLCLTFDTIPGILLGYTWKSTYLFAGLGLSEFPKFGASLSFILKPEKMEKIRDTIRIEVPIYVQVPVIVRDTIYVREQVRTEKKDTLQAPKADPRVVENLYLRGLEAYQKGNYAQALFFFQEVLKLDPKNEKALKAVERIRKILEGR